MANGMVKINIEKLKLRVMNFQNYTIADLIKWALLNYSGIV